MATRSEVLFFEEGHKDPIVFYQHWDGSELPCIVAEALQVARQEGMLQDTPYLGRIIFSEMLRHSDDPLGGYGVSFSRHEWCAYTVEVYSSYEDEPTLVMNGDNYTLDEFLDEFLKPEGAFGHKRAKASA